MSTRNQSVAIAEETVQIISNGSYQAPSGQSVSVRSQLDECICGSRLFTPEELAKLLEAHPPSQSKSSIRVINCTTISAAKQLYDKLGARKVALLNFASARKPGGGFLSGAQAQEESLARASTLYASLSKMIGYYDANRSSGTSLYTDHIIYSPEVPVFRDDTGRLLESPWSVSMITAPAPNAGAVRSQEPHNVPRIREVMNRRIEYVLALASHHGHDALVLGAWGCGVFANDPHEVAELFAGHLLGQGRYSQSFANVIFAILDGSGEIIGPFAEVFGG